MSYGITGVLGVSILIGVGRTYFVWRRWQVDYNRKKDPWERVT